MSALLGSICAMLTLLVPTLLDHIIVPVTAIWMAMGSLVNVTFDHLLWLCT